jgi:hypothetical protein
MCDLKYTNAAEDLNFLPSWSIAFAIYLAVVTDSVNCDDTKKGALA